MNKKRPSADEKLRRKLQKLTATGSVIRDEDGVLLRFVRVPGGYKVITLDEPDTAHDPEETVEVKEPVLDMTHLRLESNEETV